MFNYDMIFKKNEGMGIPYRGRCDEIKQIVKTFSAHLFKNDEKLNKVLIDSFSIYNFIKKISIEGIRCNIEFKNIEGLIELKHSDKLSFSAVPQSERVKFGEYFYDKKLEDYAFLGNCHSVALKYLELNPSANICAVTSLCVTVDNRLFFHSYIWDKDNDNIIDFSRNIVMNKHDYDVLFCYKEINALSFNEYMSYFSDVSCSSDRDKYSRLLYLALVTLEKESLVNEDNCSKVKKKSRM